MKKIIVLLAVVFGMQFVGAQEDYKSLDEMQKRLYSLASKIAKQTDKVEAHGNVISLVKSSGIVSFKKERDPKYVDIAFYKYTLVASSGREIPLNKELTEDVILKFQNVLKKVEQSLIMDASKDVGDILDSL